MIGQGRYALFVQELGRCLHLGPRKAIDDPARSLVALEKIEQLTARIGTLDDGVSDIGTIKARYELFRGLQPQPLDDVGARRGVGGGGKSDAWHMRKQFAQPDQFAIFGPEIMPPLAHAMGLVDGKQRDLDTGERFVKPWSRQTLGRHIEQVEFAVSERLAHRTGIVGRER